MNVKKFVFILLILTLGNINTSRAEQIYIDSCWGCIDKESLDDITRYIMDKNKESQLRLLKTGKCTLVSGNVYVIDQGFVVSKIDYQGKKLYLVSECVR